MHLRGSFLIVVALILCGIFGGCNCGVAGADACFGRDFLWIEAEDFMEVPIKKDQRLDPGNEVRLKSTYIVKCTG